MRADRAISISQLLGILPVFRVAMFEVIVWVRKTDAISVVRDELIRIAANDPYTSSESDGLIDLHWGFDSRAAAKRVAKEFAELSPRPEIVLVRMTSYDDGEASLTYKYTLHA